MIRSRFVLLNVACSNIMLSLYMEHLGTYESLRCYDKDSLTVSPCLYKLYHGSFNYIMPFHNHVLFTFDKVVYEVFTRRALAMG